MEKPEPICVRAQRLQAELDSPSRLRMGPLICLPVAATSPALVPFTLNFTITNLPYVPDMGHPGSARLNMTEEVLQPIVRAPRCHSHPSSPLPCHLPFSCLPPSYFSPAWIFVQEHQHRPTVFQLQTDLTQVRGSGVDAHTPCLSDSISVLHPVRVPHLPSVAGSGPL